MERKFAIHCCHKVAHLMSEEAKNYLHRVESGITSQELNDLWKQSSGLSTKAKSAAQKFADISVTFLMYQGDQEKFALDAAKVNVCRAFAHSQPDYQKAFVQMTKEIESEYIEFRQKNPSEEGKAVNG
jgi:hypothetical protein